MSRLALGVLCCACLLLASSLVGCSPADFSAADMVVELSLPDGFRWTATPVTIEDSAALALKLGPDSSELLEHNWQSSTLGQLVCEKVAIRIAVHRLASKNDAADMLAEHKYPDAKALKLGQQAYRWLDRNAAETIFFRRDAYFAQLSVEPRPEVPALEPLGARLDRLLARRNFLF